MPEAEQAKAGHLSAYHLLTVPSNESSAVRNKSLEVKQLLLLMSIGQKLNFYALFLLSRTKVLSSIPLMIFKLLHIWPYLIT